MLLPQLTLSKYFKFSVVAFFAFPVDDFATILPLCAAFLYVSWIDSLQRVDCLFWRLFIFRPANFTAPLWRPYWDVSQSRLAFSGLLFIHSVNSWSCRLSQTSSDLFSAASVLFSLFSNRWILISVVLALDIAARNADAFTPSSLLLGSALSFVSPPGSIPGIGSFQIGSPRFSLLLLALGFPSSELLFCFTVRREF